MGKGNQPLSVDVIATDRYEEREELVNLLWMAPAELLRNRDRFLARFDGRTRRVEQIGDALKIGFAWFRALSPEGNRRTRDLARDFDQTHGPLNVAAD